MKIKNKKFEIRLTGYANRLHLLGAGAWLILSSKSMSSNFERIMRFSDSSLVEEEPDSFW